MRSAAEEFQELTPEHESTGNPLGWPGYDEARERAAAPESVIYGNAVIGGVKVVLIEFEFRFLGGSVGRATGDRLVHAFRTARERGVPVVSSIATGGSRMQEGMFSLRQLQRVVKECQLNRVSGIPHIAVLRDPTTGGVWASLGSGGDVVLGVEGAQVGFAGRRVRKPEEAEHPAFTAEGQFAAGQVDAVVRPDDLAKTVGTWLELLTGGQPEPAEVPHALGEAELPESGWDAVLRARAPRRPRAQAYLESYLDSYALISGDRAGGVDSGMLCGIGRRGGRSIAFAAQTGTPTRPAGYRTATRLIGLANRLGIPVLTLIDTPGADNSAASEAAGLAPSIAGAFSAAVSTRIPVTTLVIGEGGSGGALALAGPERTWITPDGYFSVIGPQAAASILKRPEDDVPAVADQLKLRPQDLLELGLVAGIASPSVDRWR